MYEINHLLDGAIEALKKWPHACENVRRSNEHKIWKKWWKKSMELAVEHYKNGWSMENRPT